MELQQYTQNDLDVRTAVAAHGLSKKAANLAKKWRYGSITYCEQKGLEIAIEQLNIIRKYQVLKKSATAMLLVTGDGATDVASTILVNSVTISNTFLYTTDNVTTAALIADAINDNVSTPEYTATATGNSVTITVTLPGTAGNNLAVTQNGGDVTVLAEFTKGGENGVLAEDNICITETQLEFMFNNIAKFTGCCYAPLGYGYETPVDPSPNHLDLSLNTGYRILLNTGDNIKLNQTY